MALQAREIATLQALPLAYFQRLEIQPVLREESGQSLPEGRGCATETRLVVAGDRNPEHVHRRPEMFPSYRQSGIPSRKAGRKPRAFLRGELTKVP